MIIEFDTKGNEKQKEVARLWLDPSVLEILYGGAKGGGKSFLGCSLIAGDALMYPETFYFIARKSLTDLVRYTIPSLYEVFTIWSISPQYYKYNGQYHYFEFHNGSRIYLIDAAYRPSDPLYERFGSMQMTRGMIEEAGEFNRDAKANLGATIGRWKNDVYNLAPKLLMTCNPSNNFLFGDYYKPFREGRLPEWVRFVQAFPQDNKMLPETYVENLIRTLSSSQISRLVHGQWEFDDDPNLLVDYDAVCDALLNEHVLEEGDTYISTDLAGKGRDSWVVSTWLGDVCRLPIVKNFSEGKEMEEKIRDISIEAKVPRSRIVSDADGLGFYLESYLKGIREFQGGTRAEHPDKYANIKAECAYKLAEKINKRTIRIICPPEHDERVKQELMLLRGKDTNAAEQKRDIISKDRMKELMGGKSPDFLDVLIMRQIFDIKPKARGSKAATVKTPAKR